MKIQLQDFWKKIEYKLKIQDARKEAYYILKEFFQLNEKEFILNKEIELTKNQYKKILKIINERNLRKPFSYIFQKKEFYSMEFKVNEKVLIPRPETEKLIEITLEYLNHNSENQLVGLDIGTGSGCIAITLVKHSKKIQSMYAIDINKEALQIAKENAIRLLKEDHTILKFFLVDITKKINNQLFYDFDFIISNPPYVLKKEYEKLEPEIFYEPYESLVVEKPLNFFYKFFINCFKILKDKGILFLESSPTLIPLQQQILERIGIKNIRIYQDYSNFDRYIVIKK